MPRSPKPLLPPDKLIDVRFPLAGLDASQSFDRQPNRPAGDSGYARTTPAALNVRSFETTTDRARGGTRPGLQKYLSSQINGSASIQDITAIVLAKSQVTAPGSTLVLASTTQKVRLLAVADGATTYTSGTLAGTSIRACFDEEGNGYIASIGPSATYNLQITAVSPAGVELYQVNAVALNANLSVMSMVTSEGVLYVVVGSGAASRLYRISTGDGSLIDPGAWFSNAEGLPSAGSGFIGAAIGGGVLGLFGTLKLVQIDLATGTITNSTTFTAPNGGSVSRDGAIAADSSGNFYVSTEYDDGGTSNGWIKKVGGSGSVAWTVSSSVTTGFFAMPASMAYDAVNGRLAIVGTTLWDTSTQGTNSFQTRSLTTGAKVLGTQPSSTTWKAIAADGLGGFRLGKTSGTTNNAIRLASDGSTVTWTVSTGVTNGGWIASTDTQAAAAQGIMGSTREIRSYAVAGGALKRFSPLGATSIDASFLSSVPAVVFSQPVGLYILYTDGQSYKKLYLSDSVTSAWTASTAGTIPSGSSGEICRLICLWRSRVVLSGLRDDPNNAFLSAVGDPFDFDYGPTEPTSGDAVDLGTGDVGLAGDAITGLMPFNDDLLILFCDHSIEQLTGDPLFGGSRDILSDTVGGAWGRAFCRGPDGAAYFFSNTAGIYRLVPGSRPQRISQQINAELGEVDFANSVIRLSYSERQQGFLVTIAPTDSSLEATHWWWEARTNAWWPWQFAKTDFNPKVIYTLDGDAPDDRVTLLGSWDGYIRYLSGAATTDDGRVFSGYVVIGPLLTDSLDEMMLYDMQAILSENSGQVTYSVYTGNTAEAALASAPKKTGRWTSGRSLATEIRRAGHAVYLRIDGPPPWSLESIRLRIAVLGKVRRRGR